MSNTAILGMPAIPALPIKVSLDILEAAQKHAEAIHGKGMGWHPKAVRTISDFIAGAVYLHSLTYNTSK